MTSARLQQIISYAQAMKAMAEHGRGNLKDTADIVKALEELQAYHAMWASIQRAERQRDERQRAA